MNTQSNSNLTNALINADETFLTALSNKGIYNRALKEYESSITNIEIDENGESVKAAFSDGINIVINGSVQNYKCGCPSRTVCKHLVMAVIAMREKLKENNNADDNNNVGDGVLDVPQNDKEASTGGQSNNGDVSTGGQGRPPLQNNFDYIADITAKQLEKSASKKIYSTALFNVKTSAEKAVVELASVLSVTFKDVKTGKDITVRFLPSDLANLANSAVCGCKSSDFCVHKTEAVLNFIIYKKGSLPDEFFPENAQKDGKNQETVEINEYIIPYIKQFIYDIFSIGLARNSDGVSQRFNQLATICRSQDLANFERTCNRISTQYELFEKKSALFSADYLMDDLCNLILQCEEIEKGGANKDTVGVFREQYNQIPPTEFHGLGAYQWHSSSGYTGITAIFYSPELSGIATYASVMPDATNPDAIRMYNLPAPWGISTKFSAITDISMLLKGAKIRSDNNISSSNETTAQIIGRTDIFSEKLSPVRYSDFSCIAEKLWENRSGDDGENKSNQSRSVTVLALPKKYDKASFDSINQIYSFAVYDKDNRKINVSVKYEPATNLLIENLKKLEKRNLMYGPVLLRVYVDNGRLNAFPIAIYIRDDEDDISSELDLFNLSLDDIDAVKKDKDKKDSKDKKGLSKFFNW